MTRYTGPAMTLGNMRQNGVRSILAFCACGHEASLDVDVLPDFVEVPAVRQRIGARHVGLDLWTFGRIGARLSGGRRLSRDERA